MEENGTKARSFRYEDYSARRIFLRSYPLHWEVESETEDNKEVEERMTEAKDNKGEAMDFTQRTNGNKVIKKLVLEVFRWGAERVRVFRRFKHKITLYVVNCVPASLKAPTALIAV